VEYIGVAAEKNKSWWSRRLLLREKKGKKW